MTIATWGAVPDGVAVSEARRPHPHIDPDVMCRLHERCATDGPEQAAWFHRQRAHYWRAEACRQHEQWQREQLAARQAGVI